MRRAFASQAEFDTWHENAKTAAGLPIVGQNAATGEPQPEKQQTTAYTSVGPAEVDMDGNVIDPTLVAEVGDERLVARGLVDGLIRADLLTVAELAELAGAYPAWRTNQVYEVGAIRRYSRALWECVQAHTSQVDWSPPNVPALWISAAPADVIPEWVQPTGAQDAYSTGDRVTFKGSVYESVIDGNSWSPSAYPAGWTLVE